MRSSQSFLALTTTFFKLLFLFKYIFLLENSPKSTFLIRSNAFQIIPNHQYKEKMWRNINKKLPPFCFHTFGSFFMRIVWHALVSNHCTHTCAPMLHYFLFYEFFFFYLIFFYIIARIPCLFIQSMIVNVKEKDFYHRVSSSEKNPEWFV